MSSQGPSQLQPTTVPPFNQSGVLPPYIGSNPAERPACSPYKCTLSELCNQFGKSPDRKKLLDGFLNHRAALIGLGIFGIQWLDGSFIEDVELSQQRPPKDIDVVTFYFPPHNIAAIAADPAYADLFTPSLAKLKYQTDPYFVNVELGPIAVLENATYWHGLFSHQRITSIWKGTLRLVLDANQDDMNARQILVNI